MYIIDELKLNKFREVMIPRNAEYFARYGFAASPASSYSGDEYSPQPKNKVDTFADMEQYDSMMQEQESQKTD